MSSCLTCSPWTFTSPVFPNMPTSAARFSSREISFAARLICSRSVPGPPPDDEPRADHAGDRENRLLESGRVTDRGDATIKDLIAVVGHERLAIDQTHCLPTPQLDEAGRAEEGLTITPLL